MCLSWIYFKTSSSEFSLVLISLVNIGGLTFVKFTILTYSHSSWTEECQYGYVEAIYVADP